MWAMLAMARKREEWRSHSSLGRMFGDLEPLNQQTNEELRVLAQGMLEEARHRQSQGTTAGITFFGQFIDHDLTLDTSPQPDERWTLTTLVNGRTFAFDLDSVYGGGPTKSPQLYYGDKFLLGTATDGVSPDLPRNPDGKDDNDTMARNPGGAPQRREPYHRSDSPVVSCGCTTHLSTRACRSVRRTTPW